MIDKRIIPQVMCSTCGHTFPTPQSSSQQPLPPTALTTEQIEEVTCPECDTQAKPKGIMQPSGFPSLETFKRNWKKSTSITVSSSETLPNSSEVNKD